MEQGKPPLHHSNLPQIFEFHEDDGSATTSVPVRRANCRAM
jgi:hypothetical protein